MTLRDELQTEIGRLWAEGYDLRQAIIDLKEKSNAGAEPPVSRAIERLGLQDEKRLERAYEILAGSE